MDLIRIVGGRPLGGAVAVSGSKNGSLPLLAATLLMEGECVLHRIPLIDDIATMLEILRALGLEAERNAHRPQPWHRRRHVFL
jgi:UDP-N-acetylglucosamine 1-carboxyvinyltransferase